MTETKFTTLKKTTKINYTTNKGSTNL